jgi:hypothetical protein
MKIQICEKTWIFLAWKLWKIKSDKFNLIFDDDREIPAWTRILCIHTRYWNTCWNKSEKYLKCLYIIRFIMTALPSPCSWQLQSVTPPPPPPTHGGTLQTKVMVCTVKLIQAVNLSNNFLFKWWMILFWLKDWHVHFRSLAW